MTNTDPDITVLNNVLTISRQRGRVYYYEGNIFKPFVIHGSEIAFVRRAIRHFLKNNAQMVAADRKAPGYRTLVQLFDEQMRKVNEIS